CQRQCGSAFDPTAASHAMRPSPQREITPHFHHPGCRNCGMRDLAHFAHTHGEEKTVEKCANWATNELPPAFLYCHSFDPSRRAAAKAPSPERYASWQDGVGRMQ